MENSSLQLARHLRSRGGTDGDILDTLDILDLVVRPTAPL
jgi:hypothetical protein